jgi:SAM-dependent methyltransferase
VLHHTPNAGAAVDEIHRVLRKGGTAYVALYRFIAPKVLAARSIRFIARGVDRVAGRDKYLYRLCGQLGSNHFLGTMLLECLGVPILCSYTKGRVREMFGRFESVTIHPVGFGLPLALSRWMDRGTNPLGTLWLIKATKNAH